MANHEHIKVVYQGKEALEAWQDINIVQNLDLRNAIFTDHNFTGYDFSRANLSNAVFFNCNFNNALLTCANLYGATLTDCSFIGAGFYDTIGNGRQIITLQIYPYTVNIIPSANTLQIGCERHTFDEWKRFTYEEIEKMDTTDTVTWWKEWKDLIFQAVEKI